MIGKVEITTTSGYDPGDAPQFPLRDLNEQERERFNADLGYRCEDYPDGQTKRYWPKAILDRIALSAGNSGAFPA